MRYLPIILFLLASLQSRAQFSSCYYYAVAKANYLVTYESDCQGALAYLKRAFEAANDTIPKDLLLAAKVYDCLGKTDSVVFCLEKAVLKAGYQWEEIKNYSTHNLYEKYETYLSLLKDIHPKLIVQYQSKLDLDWYTTLISIEKLDQHLRKSAVRAELEKCPAQGAVKYPLMAVTDSINWKLFIEKTEKQGFPPLRYMDFKANTAVFLLFIHGGSEFDWAMSFMEEILDEQLLQGNLPPYFYSKAYDRYLQQRLGKKQSFGAYNPACEGRIICPIENIDEVDKRRLAIGLLPLSESWEAMTGYELPKDYTAPSQAKIEEWLGDCW